ncbi:DMT family transporter [Granulicella arctica]|uniref:Drug/metabolite transporter (DMT)-like permease n=1 Tax=Granulicella arctica TaxID=940613 RepID=A0A7Y9PFP3_9BACT|nr:DMT family transporter [Granulicella arctica]NYF78855.1 drug/metabolite transporter (DMT)-like permease [Granulicella arctica]
MPGIASAFYRMFFSSVAIWPFLLSSRTKLASIHRLTLWLAALGGVFFAGDVGLYNIAVMHTSAGSATFLGNNAPILVGLLTWATTRRAPSPRFWTALAIALLGACLIVSVDAQHQSSRSSADFLAVMASVCFALYLMTTERLRESCDTRTLLTLSTTASSVILLVVAVSAHISLRVPSISSMAALLGLGLVCQLMGYFCLTYALGHLPATITSVMLLAVGPLAALFALFLFKEHMATLQILGGGLVVLGVWIVSSSRRDQHLSSEI